jgi:phage nucleotide-binding protein
MDITSPAVASKAVKMLIYGRPGVGKTVFAATANGDSTQPPEQNLTGPALLLDVEGGTMSIATSQPNIDVVRISDYKSNFSEVYAYLTEKKPPERKDYKTIIFDSLTETQKLSMLGIMALVATKPDRDPDMPTIGEWGKNIEQIRKLVRYYRDLPFNLIITCLEQEVKNEVTGEILIKPSMSGKLADEVCGFCDIVGRMIVVKPDPNGPLERHLVVQPTGNFVAKDRSNNLGLFVKNPTFPQIYNLVYGEAKPVLN